MVSRRQIRFVRVAKKNHPMRVEPKNTPEQLDTPLFEVVCALLGGGNSNIIYVHPDPWGNDPI